MAPVRLSSIVRHRKSSASTLASIANIKAGQSSSVIFAPNVTPITYAEDALAEEGSPPQLTAELLADASLFPPGESLLGDLNARRSHGARKKGADYIPRPPNAFMLFRADFVKQRHVPGSIESTHGSLSKIIGTCWRHLPHEEKHVWEIKAKHAKAEHKARYPNYRFRPVHNKVKKVTKPQSSPEEEARCDSVARLLLEGKKGDELTREVRALDDALTQAQAATAAKRSREIASQQAYEAAQRLHAPVASRYAPYPHRRSSSVPPMLSNITIPTVPFLHSESRPRSPQPASASSMFSQASSGRTIRRPSSVPPIPPMNWFQTPMQAEPYSAMDSPLPEPDTSMFNQAFFGNSPFGAPQVDHSNAGFSWAPEAPSVAPHHQMMPPMDMSSMHAPPSLDFSFTENGLAPHELPTPASATLPTPGFGGQFDMSQASSFMAPLAHAPSYMGQFGMDLQQQPMQEYAYAPHHQQADGSPASNSPAPSDHELFAPSFQPHGQAAFYAPAPTDLAPHHHAGEILLAPEFNFESGQANSGGVEFAAGMFDGMPRPAPGQVQVGGEVYPKFSASEFRMSRFDFTA